MEYGGEDRKEWDEKFYFVLLIETIMYIRSQKVELCKQKRGDVRLTPQVPFTYPGESWQYNGGHNLPRK